MRTANVSIVRPGMPHPQQLSIPGRSKTLACTYCRSKKIRCNNAQPCRNCIEHGEECVFVGRRARKKREPNPSRAALEKKVAYYEELFQQGQPKTVSNKAFDCQAFQNGVETSPAFISDSIPQQSLQEASGQATPGVSSSEDAQVRREVASSPKYSTQPEILPNAAVASVTSLHPSGSAFGQAGSGTTMVDASACKKLDEGYTQRDDLTKGTCEADGFGCVRAVDDEESSTLSQLRSGLEYHGPRSSMSLCSKVGIDWVQARVPETNFKESAWLFLQDLGKRLKIEKPLSPQRSPEPSEQDAWKYTRAYFTEAHEAALGIVHRPWFEARLQAHFTRTERVTDAAWYALRNIIYAVGCRIECSKTMSFAETQQTCWPWFENALSVEIQLVYWHTTIIGVQALALMAYFSEAISSPLLQYMLCSTAVRVAFAKGMHRRPSPSWDIEPSEESLRSCIFWALFCLEKQQLVRGDRPSCIDDDQVTCRLPTASPTGSAVNLRYFTTVIKLNQLSSIVSKKLSSVSSLRLPSTELISNLNIMSERLDRLKETIASETDIKLPINLAQLPPGLSNHEALTIQFLYYSILWQIHTPLFYPWSRVALLDSKQVRKLQANLSSSASIITESSKQAVLDSKYIHLDANCPLLVGYYVPMHAVTNLFISILQDPASPLALSQANLMMIGSGYFARIDLESDGHVARPLVTDMTQIAQNAIRAAKSTSLSKATSEDIQMLETVNSPTADGSSLAGENVTNQQPWDANDEEWLDLDLGYDFEMWSTLMPAPGPNMEMLDSIF